MATAEELLAQMEENPELYADSVGPVNDVIVINAETRTIELPESEKLFGVESDKASERKYFKCPKIVGDNIDLSALNLFINFKNANNEGDIYPIDDVEVDGDYIAFSWKLSKKVTAYKTDASKNQLLSFIFCAKNGEGPENEWNTTICSDGIVLEGLEPGESIAEDNPDIIQYILERLDSAGTITPEQISGAVEEYFASNPIEETDPTVPAWAKEETPDKTLSEEGKAADAKEVGDRLGQLSDEIENLSKNGLTTEQINALDGMFKVTAFSNDPTSAYNAFKTAFGIDSGSETEKTLYSISATYNGGDIATGTSLTDLTGIIVTAHYSDGSTENVTGYTLSGEIVDGENTISVSYGGLTTTFTVTGVSSSETTVELIADGLQCNYDFRGVTLESYNLTGWGNVYRMLDKTGNEFIFGTPSAEGDVTYGLKYGFRERRLASSETTTTKFGENYTVQALYYDCNPSLFGWGENVVLGNTVKVKPRYVNTSGSEVAVSDTSQVSFVTSENKFKVATYIVSGANLKIYYDNTLLYELDGSSYEDFDHWVDFGVPNNVYTAGYCVAFVGYNRALSNVEIVDNMEYFESMEVGA